jgi:hypothetical protein
LLGESPQQSDRRDGRNAWRGTGLAVANRLAGDGHSCNDRPAVSHRPFLTRLRVCDSHPRTYPVGTDPRA